MWDYRENVLKLLNVSLILLKPVLFTKITATVGLVHEQTDAPKIISTRWSLLGHTTYLKGSFVTLLQLGGTILFISVSQQENIGHDEHWDWVNLTQWMHMCTNTMRRLCMRPSVYKLTLSNHLFQNTDLFHISTLNTTTSKLMCIVGLTLIARTPLWFKLELWLQFNYRGHYWWRDLQFPGG